MLGKPFGIHFGVLFFCLGGSGWTEEGAGV